MTNMWLYLATLAIFVLIYFFILLAIPLTPDFRKRFFNFGPKAFIILAFFCMPFNTNHGKTVFTVMGNAVNPEGDVFSLMSFYQVAKSDAVSFIGVPGYQKGNNAQAIIGIPGYQKSEQNSQLFFGISLYQDAGREAEIDIGISVYQKARQRAITLFAMSLIQKIVLEDGSDITRTFAAASDLKIPEKKMAIKKE